MPEVAVCEANRSKPAGLDDASEELAGAGVFRGGEDPLGLTLFEDSTGLEKADAVCYVAGEAHLVGRDEHGHPFTCQLLDDGEDLGDQFRVEGAGDLVEEHEVRTHRERPNYGDPLLLAA